MKIFISELENEVPEGYRKLQDMEVINNYLSLDMNKDFKVSKNEWMLAFIKILGEDLKSLEADGPDSIMKRIKELSDEFDYYDADGNKYLEYEEYKKIINNNLYISE